MVDKKLGGLNYETSFKEAIKLGPSEICDPHVNIHLIFKDLIDLMACTDSKLC
jgi:hypothetical protein